MGFLKIEVLENGREVLKMKNSVVATVITADWKILVGTQTRPGSLDENGNVYKSMGCVAGYVDDGEVYEDALLRELMEEANLDGFAIHFLDLNNGKPKASSEGYSTEKSKMYIGIINLTSDAISRIMKCNDVDEDITLSFIEPDIDLLDNIPGMKSFYVIQQAMHVISFLKGNSGILPVKLEMNDPNFKALENLGVGEKVDLPINYRTHIGKGTIFVQFSKYANGMLDLTTKYNSEFIYATISKDTILGLDGIKAAALEHLRSEILNESNL